MHGGLEKVKFYGVATLGTKGQIVIPTEARKELELVVGDKIIIVHSPHDGGLSLIKAEALEGMIQDMHGKDDEFQSTIKRVKDLADKEREE